MCAILWLAMKFLCSRAPLSRKIVRWEHRTAPHIFVLCGFWHNFRQFLSISRTPPRTVRACIEHRRKTSFPMFQVESQYQVQIAVRYFHNLSITRGGMMMMMMSIGGSNAKRGGEERRRGKKVQWNFSIRDFLRNEEINFKIPIVSRTFRLVCTLWALSRESISMAGFGRAGEGVRWFIDVQIIAELRLISVRRTTQLSSRVNSLEIL